MTSVQPTPSTPQWNHYNGPYVPLTPNNLGAAPYPSPNGNSAGGLPENPSAFTQSPRGLGATPSPPTPNNAFMMDSLQRGSSIGGGSMYTTGVNHPMAVPIAGEGSSASMRLFPQTTVYTATHPMYSHVPNVGQYRAIHPTTSAPMLPTMNGSMLPPLTPLTPLQPTNATAGDATGNARKRQRTEYEEAVASANAAGETNLNPPSTLFNSLFQAAATSAPGTAPKVAVTSGAGGGTSGMHLHTSMESIQASLDNLQAVQASQNAAAAAAAAQAAAAAAHGGDDDSSRSSTPDPGRKKGAAAPAKRGRKAKGTTAAAPAPAADTSMDHDDAPDNDGSRKSKHRLIEKQRRDELKKNMETLSGMIGYAQSTNKNGVVKCCIAYLNARNAELALERQRTKTLQDHIASLEKKNSELEAAQQANQTALVPQAGPGGTQLPPGTVSFKAYQALFSQYQEIQVHYTELTSSVANMKGLLSTPSASGFLNGKMMTSATSVPPAAQNTTTAVKKQQPQILASSDYSPTGYHPPRATSPFSPFPSGRSIGDDTNETTNGNSATNHSSSNEYDVFGFGNSRRPSLDGPGTGNAMSLALSTTLKQQYSPSPVDYRCTFQSAGTVRLLLKDNIVIDCTERFCQDVGYSYNELIGMHIEDLTPTVKQPMCRLVSQRSIHGGEPIGILNCYKTKKGGVVFRYGMLEWVWDSNRCEHQKDGAAPAGASMEVLTPSSTGSGESGSTPVMPMSSSASASSSSSNDPSPATSMPPPSHGEKFVFPTPPPCSVCGVKPKYSNFIGLPTHYTDIDHYLLLSVRAAIRAFDPEITMVGVELSEFYTRGKVTYEVSQPNPNGLGGTITTKVTKLLPMLFSQVVQIYEQLARTASATKTTPPKIEL